MKYYWIELDDVSHVPKGVSFNQYTWMNEWMMMNVISIVVFCCFLELQASLNISFCWCRSLKITLTMKSTLPRLQRTRLLCSPQLRCTPSLCPLFPCPDHHICSLSPALLVRYTHNHRPIYNVFWDIFIAPNTNMTNIIYTVHQNGQLLQCYFDGTYFYCHSIILPGSYVWLKSLTLHHVIFVSSLYNTF